MIAQSLGGSLTLARDVILIVLGIVLGGGLNILVTRIVIWLRRRSIASALLCHVRYSCTTAEGVGAYLRTQVLPDWSKSRLSVSHLERIDTNLWQAALQDLDNLPRADLIRMFSFYQFASAVNSRLAVIQEEQEMLQNVTVEEGQTSANAQRLTLLVREAVLRNGSLVAQMCEQMARYKAICSFSELPDNLFTT